MTKSVLKKIEKVVLIVDAAVATAKEARFEEGTNGAVRLVLKDAVGHSPTDEMGLSESSDFLLKGEVIVLSAGT